MPERLSKPLDPHVRVMRIVAAAQAAAQPALADVVTKWAGGMLLLPRHLLAPEISLLESWFEPIVIAAIIETFTNLQLTYESEMYLSGAMEAARVVDILEGENVDDEPTSD